MDISRLRGRVEQGFFMIVIKSTNMLKSINMNNFTFQCHAIMPGGGGGGGRGGGGDITF